MNFRGHCASRSKPSVSRKHVRQMDQTSTGLSIGELIDANGRYHAGEPALVMDGRTVTHAQYADRVRRLASGLHQRGMRHQDRVSMLSMNSIEFVEVYGAAEYAGYIASTV